VTPEAPDIGGHGAARPGVGFRREPLGAEVGAAVEDPGRVEVADLDLAAGVGEEVVRLDVEVRDATGVELGQPHDAVRGRLGESRTGRRQSYL
jgi:hypothetical protein